MRTQDRWRLQQEDDKIRKQKEKKLIETIYQACHKTGQATCPGARDFTAF
ncbi:hypothetical protein LEMLEM_LOCUS21632 [Lemmus lemmus]